MKIAFLIPDANGPSTRYRVLKYIPYIEKDGHETDVFIIRKGLWQRYLLFKNLRKYDVVFLHRKLFRYIDLHMLRKYVRRLIYDFDDAVMFRDPNSAKQFSRTRSAAFKCTVKNADLVIAGNEYLRAMALEVNPSTILIPTSLDMDRYTEKPDTEPGKLVTLGWIGSGSTLMYLANIRDTLDDLHDVSGNTQLKIIADRFIECSRMPVINKKWKEEEEIADIHSIDIGLMPLTNDPWSQGKCGFKLLQYMAAGIPPVCSPVGANKSIVADGVNGFWADSREEWIEKLGILIKDSSLRREFGRKARETVDEHYSINGGAHKIIAAFTGENSSNSTYR